MDSRKKRDGAFLENLCTYDALKIDLVFCNVDSVADWITKGPIPSETVKKIQKQYTKQMLVKKDHVDA